MSHREGIPKGSLTFFGDVFEFNYHVDSVGLEVVGSGRLLHHETDDPPPLADTRLGRALAMAGKSYEVTHIELIDLGMNSLNLRGVAKKYLSQLLKGVPSVQSAKETDRLAAARDYLRQFPNVDGSSRVHPVRG